MNEYLFEYHFGGATWGITIHAGSAAEAKEKIKAVGMAAYKGEVKMTVKMPELDWLDRLASRVFGVKPR